MVSGNLIQLKLQLGDFIQHINDTIDNNDIVVGIFFDLSRAFDTLHADFVSDKLYNLGIRGNINKCLISYLTQRKFYVRQGDVKSKQYNIDIGTPQGSVLGPQIFLLYVNDLPEHISEGKTFMYADDTSVIISHPDPNEISNKVNITLQQFCDWCNKNRLIINADKTVIIQFHTRFQKSCNFNFSLYNNTIKLEQKIKFLGSIVDGQLTWEPHITFLSNKLNKVYYVIGQLKNRLSSDSLLSVYYALCYSAISYNIVVWGRSVHVKRIFILQKRIIRLLYNLDISYLVQRHF